MNKSKILIILVVIILIVTATLLILSHMNNEKDIIGLKNIISSTESISLHGHLDDSIVEINANDVKLIKKSFDESEWEKSDYDMTYNYYLLLDDDLKIFILSAENSDLIILANQQQYRIKNFEYDISKLIDN